jgi:hypothetical protein
MNGRIYKIISPSTSKFFIGSTTLPIESCFQRHMNSYANYCQYPKYIPFISTFEILKYNDASIQLLAEKIVHTHEQLYAIQSEYIEHCVNQSLIIMN